MKKCFKCKKSKDLSCFYKHSGMFDGYLGKCKECTKKDSISHRESKKEYYKSYDRYRALLPHRIMARQVYQNSHEAMKKRLIGIKKWQSNNPEKRKAQIALNNAIRDEKIFKNPCELCGSIKKIHGHHDDYSKPLKVNWLCARHHLSVHLVDKFLYKRRQHGLCK